MGKWSYLKDKLPPLPDEEPKHKQLVEEAKKRQFSQRTTLGEFAKFYVSIRALKEESETQLKAIQIEIDACEDIIKNMFDQQQVHRMTLESGETISTSPEPHAKVVDHEAMVAWAKSVELEKSLTLPWQTLNGQLKQLLENGKPAMPGVEAFLRTKVSLRRNK